MGAQLPERSVDAVHGRGRLVSLDILRGLVIVLMILDHVREFLHSDAVVFDPLDPERTTALLYATRWITHFCAPTFVFLTGVSAWLQRARGRSTRELSWFLLTRGLWLVLLEFTVTGFGWSFSIPFLWFLQVIWAIGCALVGLAAFVWLPRLAVLAVGVAIILGHNLLDPITPDRFGAYADLWTALHVPGMWVRGGEPVAFDVYPLLPWFGVMLGGYGLGQVFLMSAPRRDRLLVALGTSMLATFLVLRYFNAYGNPAPWRVQPSTVQSVMAFLNVEKYPPSLFYVLATLGPVLALVPLIERWRGAAARFFMVFGSVPLFAYVVHIYVAHALSVLLRLATGQSLAGQFDLIRVVLTHREVLLGSGYPLWVVYAVWLVLVLALYPLCRWYAALKARRREWWLSYL